MDIHPTKAEFLELSRKGNVVPVYTDLMADFETPVSAYAKLRAHGPAYLLESVEGGERLSRYSFIGCRPRKVFACGPDVTEIRENGAPTRTIPTPADPLSLIEGELRRFRPVKLPGMPRFTGGAVGYISYEYVTRIEPTVPAAPRDELKLPAHLLHAFGHAPDLRPGEADAAPLRERPRPGRRGRGGLCGRQAELRDLFDILRKPSSLAPAPLR